MTLYVGPANKDLPFCECGCGERVSKLGNRFLFNHHSRNPEVYGSMVRHSKMIKGVSWERRFGKKKARMLKERMSKIHKGKICSDSLKEQWSKSRKGSKNGFFRKKHTEKTIEMIRKANVGKKFSEKTKRKISASLAKAVLNGKMNNSSPQYWKGEFFSKKNGCYIKYRSSYELFAFEILEKMSKVKNYEHEPFSIQYLDKNSRVRNYVPDLLITYIDDTQELIEIKPRNFIQKKANVLKFNGAMVFCKDNNMDFSILTSKKGNTDVYKVGMCKIPFYKKRNSEKEVVS